ncbi:MAG: ion channel [Candidatus Jacksonbacteria bacterium]
MFLQKIASIAIRRKVIFRVAGMLLIIYVFMAIGVFLAEKANPSGNIKSIGDAFWFPLITLTTIGYGDRFPVSVVGRVITSFGILTGLGLMATLLSELPALAMARAERREKGLETIKVSGHVVICNWQEEAATLAKEIIAGDTPINHAVIVSRGERPFEDQHNLSWISGNPSDEETLRRASIDTAAAVIAFPPEQEVLREGEVADSLSLMIFSTVRRMAPDIWSGVFLNREENRSHFGSANAVINPWRIAAMLMTQAKQDFGVDILIGNRLLSNFEGQTCFTRPMPQGFDNWGALSLHCRIYGWLAVAIVRGEKVIENPPDKTALVAGDKMIVIAPSRPVVS